MDSLVGLTSFSAAWLLTPFSFPKNEESLALTFCSLWKEIECKKRWGCFCDNGLGFQTCNLGRDHSWWIFCLCEINYCLVVHKSEKVLHWKRFCIWKNKIPSHTHRAKTVWRASEFGFPTAMITVQQSYMFVNQIPKLVQENHLPHSFLKTDAIKSLARIAACSCCFMHTEAHTFTSFSYRGSLFPPCPWSSWLLRYCRICVKWGGEGRV